ncbi:MAG: cupin domain-containing protein [Candidatus Solibacter usitatus]|nr:cupin domain-containing protein [Candidatus Solibacter usitatus]
MDLSRRELPFLLPLLTGVAAAADVAKLTSKTWRHEELPVRENGQNRSRAVFNGESAKGFGLEMHETELAPGLMPHAAHSHAHHEMVILREGTLEVTISGKSSRIGPGGIAYVASNEEHGWRNVGTDRARYYVIALGR